MKHVIATAMASTFLAGCQSLALNESHGWNGEGAEPFDGAKAECIAEVGNDLSSEAFYNCMKEKGWTRT